MKCLALVLLLGVAAGSQAQLPAARWVAISNTAMGVTGDLRTVPGQLVMHGSRIAAREERPLDATSLATAAKLFSLPSPNGASGSIYSVHIPAATRFKNGNTLCGREPVSFALVVFSPAIDGSRKRAMSLAFFSGAAAPDLHTDAYRDSTALCGTYGYEKAGR